MPALFLASVPTETIYNLDLTDRDTEWTTSVGVFLTF